MVGIFSFWCTCLLLLSRISSGVRSPLAKLRGRRADAHDVAKSSRSHATPIEQLLIDLESMRQRTDTVAEEVKAVQAKAYKLEAYVGRITDNASSVLQGAVGAAQDAHRNKGIVKRLRGDEAILNGSALTADDRFVNLDAGLAPLTANLTEVEATLAGLPDTTAMEAQLGRAEANISAFRPNGTVATMRDTVKEEMVAYEKEINATVNAAVDLDLPPFIKDTIGKLDNMSSYTNLLGTPPPFADPPCNLHPTWPPPNASTFEEASKEAEALADESSLT